MRLFLGVLTLVACTGIAAGRAWADPDPAAPTVGWTGIRGLVAHDADGATLVCPHRPEAPAMRIGAVDPDSPAARAGIVAGDWVQQLQGKPVGTEADARRAILLAPPGTPVRFGLARADGAVEVPVVPEARPLRALALARLEAATLWLCAQQRRHGGWNNPGPRGEIKPATHVSSLCLLALASAPPAASAPTYENTLRSARDRATEFVLAYQAPDGGIDQKDSPRYRVFSSSFALLALLQLDAEANRNRAAQLRNFLLRSQMVPGPKLAEDHTAVGGWNYHDEFQPNNLKVEVTVTAWALDALAAARGIDELDVSETLRRAERFVSACWNSPAAGVSPGDWADGGFLTHPRHSKAGEREIDLDVFQYRSYGSATADAFRALGALGIPPEDPRSRSARSWLARNFSVSRNPGFPEHAPVAYDHGIFYYYLLSLARGFDRAGITTLVADDAEGAGHDWRRDLALELIVRQEPDGFWKNPVPIMSEDEPVIATALGILALQHAVRTMP